MKLRFFMSQHRENSVRDEVIGKKWVYLERYTSIESMRFLSKGKSGPGRSTLHRVWATSEGKRPRNMEWLVFTGWVIALFFLSFL